MQRGTLVSEAELPDPHSAAGITFRSLLKWAGGKSWLVASGKLPVPADFNRYIEPFMGGGAVFFHLRPKQAVLSDVNADLIELYKVIKDQPDALWTQMRKHHRNHCKDYYYAMRDRAPRTELQRAARFLYLNRTCWNGLYRVNLSGEFNVPLGTKQTVVFDDDDFHAVSTLLKGATLKCRDFELTIDHAKSGDFVFVDPPYTVKHNCNGFKKYNERIFSWDDQVRLSAAVRRAGKRGAQIVVTNADHASVRELYEPFSDYESLERQSVLAGDPTRRGPTTEAMFLVGF